MLHGSETSIVVIIMKKSVWMINEKNISKKLLLKSSAWYTASNFLTKAMSFITIPIFTRLMTKEQYGDFSVFAGWQSIFLIICGIEIYATLNRARFDYAEDGSLNSYITSSLVLSTLITTVILTLYLLFPNFFDNLFLLDRKYIFIMFAYIYVQPAFLMFQAKQRIEYRYKLSAALSFILIVVSTVVAVVFVYSIDDRLMGRILGQYVPYIVVGLIFYIYFLRKSFVVKTSIWKYALTLGLPLVFSFLGSQILLTADRVVVKQLGSAEEVAWLVLAASCTNIILIFVQTLNNAWAPWFFDKLKVKSYCEIRKTFKIYMWFIIFCTFCALMVGPEIVQILGGSGYKESIYVLPANMLCGVFTALSSQFVNLETYYKKTHYAAILTSIVAAINIVGDVIGVLIFGYQAVCYITVICQLFLIVMHYFATKKLNIGEILTVKDMTAILGISMLFIPLSLALYQIRLVRLGFITALIVIACLIAIVKRRKLITLIIKFKRSK